MVAWAVACAVVVGIIAAVVAVAVVCARKFWSPGANEAVFGRRSTMRTPLTSTDHAPTLTNGGPLQHRTSTESSWVHATEPSDAPTVQKDAVAGLGDHVADPSLDEERPLYLVVPVPSEANMQDDSRTT